MESTERVKEKGKKNKVYCACQGQKGKSVARRKKRERVNNCIVVHLKRCSNKLVPFYNAGLRIRVLQNRTQVL